MNVFIPRRSMSHLHRLSSPLLFDGNGIRVNRMATRQGKRNVLRGEPREREAQRLQAMARQMWTAHPLYGALKPIVDESWLATGRMHGAKRVACRDAVRHVFLRHLCAAMQHLDTSQCGSWRSGNVDQNERDLVCLERPAFSMAVELSAVDDIACSGALLHMRNRHCALGAFELPRKAQYNAAQNTWKAPLFAARYFWPEGFQLLINYCAQTHSLRSVRVGWLEESDWRVMAPAGEESEAFDCDDSSSAPRPVALVTASTLTSKTIALH